MFEQLQKGLQLYGLPDVMEQNMDLCRPLFVPLQDNKVKNIKINSFVTVSCEQKPTNQWDSINHLPCQTKELQQMSPYWTNKRNGSQLVI